MPNITAKELAKKLNISATAVSMALNNKPGVSTKTKNRIIDAAEKYGYDFSKLTSRKNKSGSIYVLWYRSGNVITSYSPIFNELMEGIQDECSNQGYKVNFIHHYDKIENLQIVIDKLRVSDCLGLIVLGTELEKSATEKILTLHIPIVILDSYFESLNCNYVLINNRQGAYIATTHLIRKIQSQPGHLKSSYPLRNFKERNDGFTQALRDNGLSPSLSIIHSLSPSIDAAYSDMLEIIDSGKPLAKCYFADNDLIAIGAIQALKARNYTVPDDIAIVGFDNISESSVIDPGLTTINIPRQHMAKLSVKRLIDNINEASPFYSKTEVSIQLIERNSV